jgi:hypothetical protein
MVEGRACFTLRTALEETSWEGLSHAALSAIAAGDRGTSWKDRIQRKKAASARALTIATGKADPATKAAPARFPALCCDAAYHAMPRTDTAALKSRHGAFAANASEPTTAVVHPTPAVAEFCVTSLTGGADVADADDHSSRQDSGASQRFVNDEELSADAPPKSSAASDGAVVPAALAAQCPWLPREAERWISRTLAAVRSSGVRYPLAALRADMEAAAMAQGICSFEYQELLLEAMDRCPQLVLGADDEGSCGFTESVDAAALDGSNAAKPRSCGDLPFAAGAEVPLVAGAALPAFADWEAAADEAFADTLGASVASVSVPNIDQAPAVHDQAPRTTGRVADVARAVDDGDAAGAAGAGNAIGAHAQAAADVATHAGGNLPEWVPDASTAFDTLPSNGGRASPSAPRTGANVAAQRPSVSPVSRSGPPYPGTTLHPSCAADEPASDSAAAVTHTPGAVAAFAALCSAIAGQPAPLGTAPVAAVATTAPAALAAPEEG